MRGVMIALAILLAAPALGQLKETQGGTGAKTYTKGDLLCAESSTSLLKLGVGTDTHVLTADSAQTCGVKWAAAAAGAETDPTLTDDAAVTVGDGSSGDVTLTWDGDAGTDGALVWDVSEDDLETSGTLTAGDLQLGNVTAASAACLAVSSDQIYHDTDCDGTKDAGEEFIDQAGGGGGGSIDVWYATSRDNVETEASTSYNSATPGAMSFVGTTAMGITPASCSCQVYVDHGADTGGVRLRDTTAGATIWEDASISSSGLKSGTCTYGSWPTGAEALEWQIKRVSGGSGFTTLRILNAHCVIGE